MLTQLIHIGPIWFQENLTRYRRLKSLPVRVGKLIIGEKNPIWIQSMVNTDTMNTAATVKQIKQLFDVGCDIVRVTVPNLNSARHLEVIKNQLISTGYDVPLVADVHFTPQAAMIAAEIVEKVRINPGNFVDRKHFDQKEYSEDQYTHELKRIEDKLIPLLEVCQKNNTALRIGSNHGSLSDRIFNRYGDGPEGMVQSALEFLDICEQVNFNQVVFSMKSSNTLVMVAAYRLLAHRFSERETFYPIHLGVTEAGDNEDGRAKSALGIGSLLMDGIGDTIRVSLTEDPEKEVPVARKIIDSVHHLTSIENEHELKDKIKTAKGMEGFPIYHFNPFEFNRSETHPVDTWGESRPAQLIFSPNFSLKEKSDLTQIGLHQIPTTEKWHSTHSPDLLFLSGKDIPLLSTFKEAGQKILLQYHEYPEHPFSLYSSWSEYANGSKKKELAVVLIDPSQTESIIQDFQKNPKNFSNIVLSLKGGKQYSLRSLRHTILVLKGAGIHQPMAIFLNRLNYTPANSDKEAVKITQAIYIGYLMVDGVLDGIFMEGDSTEDLHYMFTVLQASRQRISKPEYISCPSCGRTLFDLQEITAKVKAATQHLVGVKIAVMGCVVNGPGEMADADFGYVGSGPKKITLYKGKEVRVRNVDSEHAVEELVNLIKREGYWKEAETTLV